jgi:hypothetical protein
MPLSQEELDILSMDLEFARPDLCTILRPTEVRDAGGATKRAYASIGAVTCRIEAQNRVMQEQLSGNRITPVVNYLVNLPRGTELGADYRIIVRDVVLEITGVPGLESYYAEMRLPCLATDDTVFA